MGKRFNIEFNGMNKLVANVTKLNGNVKQITDKALVRTNQLVTDKAEVAMARSKLPAGGRYSTGQTVASLRRGEMPEWAGTLAGIKTGFDIRNGGLASIFLIHGTQRMKPVRGLHAAFFGKATHEAVINEQQRIFDEEIRRLMQI